jgi:hypothetical protein
MGADAIRGRRREVSASIRIKIIAGTDIVDAYDDCAAVSSRLGGMSVETDFNGVEMVYHHQSLKDWKEGFHQEIYGKSKGGAS